MKVIKNTSNFVSKKGRFDDRELRDKAIKWLETSKDSSAVSKFEAKLKELEAENKALKSEMKALNEASKKKKVK